MSTSYKLDKHCLKCGCRITDKNKTGYCNHHRDRTGANNPFWGRTHSAETIAKIKEVTAEATRQLWANAEYRKKVIEHLTGTTRTDEFKRTQSENAKRQFTNPYQREIRSKRMKQSWAEGKIVSHESSCNYSDEQLEFGKHLMTMLGAYSDRLECVKTIQYDGNSIVPDFIYGNYVVEYNGDYWHANPLLYHADDLIHGQTAKEIWERDRHRQECLESLGYTVINVWGSDSKKSSETVMKSIVDQLIQK